MKTTFINSIIKLWSIVKKLRDRLEGVVNSCWVKLTRKSEDCPMQVEDFDSSYCALPDMVPLEPLTREELEELLTPEDFLRIEELEKLRELGEYPESKEEPPLPF